MFNFYNSKFKNSKKNMIKVTWNLMGTIWLWTYEICQIRLD